MVADKGKKLKVDDNDETPLIDAHLVLSIENLQEIQDDLEKINEKASDEVLEIEKKYNEIRKPVYDKRNEIIQAIPHFWVTAFLSHPALSELVIDEDNQIFKHLISIEVEDSRDVKSGYSISFNFSPNTYFENKKLTKTFTFLDEGTTKVTATTINWKGSEIPNGADNEKKGNKRPHSEESFFTWFTETQQNDDDIHDEVAEIIKEDLWPNPLTYFHNDADEVDFDGDEDDEEEKDEGSDDEDDEEGEDDE